MYRIPKRIEVGRQRPKVRKNTWVDAMAATAVMILVINLWKRIGSENVWRNKIE